MSRSTPRLLATALSGLAIAVAALGQPAAATLAAAAGPANTWTPLTTLPERMASPVLALAVSPSDGQRLLAGTPAGAIYASADAGASWKLVKTGLGRGVSALAFDTFQSGVVLAGTRSAGLWRSTDGGLTWQAAPGAEGRTVRVLGFAKSFTVAGTDGGVLIQPRGSPAFSASGLPQIAVSALAVAAVNDPSKLVAGGDATRGTEPLPLYSSADGGKSWAPVSGAVGGSSLVSALAAGPLPPSQAIRPLLMGTNTGLFGSADNGATWQAVTGGGVLPETDYTSLAFLRDNAAWFYAASDGGASDRGGVWVTSDSGGHFSSLNPPVPAVTALAVSSGSVPVLYAATFRPSDHAVVLWTYRDAGGAPQASAPTTQTSAAPAPVSVATPAPSTAALPKGRFGWLAALIRGPEGPYLGLGVAALLILAVAIVFYARRTRRL